MGVEMEEVEGEVVNDQFRLEELLLLPDFVLFEGTCTISSVVVPSSSFTGVKVTSALGECSEFCRGMLEPSK
jgi:hypothetical protein